MPMKMIINEALVEPNIEDFIELSGETPENKERDIDLIKTTLSDLVSREESMIQDVNSVLVTLKDTLEELPNDIGTILEDLVATEYCNKGQLQALLMSYDPEARAIEQGQKEGKEKIETSESLILR